MYATQWVWGWEYTMKSSPPPRSWTYPWPPKVFSHPLCCLVREWCVHVCVVRSHIRPIPLSKFSICNTVLSALGTKLYNRSISRTYLLGSVSINKPYINWMTEIEITFKHTYLLISGPQRDSFRYPGSHFVPGEEEKLLLARKLQTCFYHCMQTVST